jgi:hypothetical protein
MNFQRVMVNNATNVGFRETGVETKEDDVRTGVTSNEALLMTVKSTPSHTVILVVVIGVLSSIIPTLRESRVNEETRKYPTYPAVKFPLLPLSVVLVPTVARPWATVMPGLLSHVPFAIVRSHDDEEWGKLRVPLFVSRARQIRTNKRQQTHLLHPTMAGHGMPVFSLWLSY